MTDKARHTVISLLGKALNLPDESQLPKDIENELFQMNHGVTKDYKVKSRSLAFNIKKNVKLRQAIITGSLSAKQLCCLSPLDMADDQLKDQRNAMQQNMRESVAVSDENLDKVRYVSGTWVSTQEASEYDGGMY